MHEAIKRLQDQGYITDFAKKVRYATQDFFGCWDIIAIHPKKKTIRFVQVSANRWTKRDWVYRRKLMAFPKLKFATCEYWTKKDGQWDIKFI